jgi:hypothetical protein
MVPAAESVNRVFHSGNRTTFHKRLHRCFFDVTRKLDDMSSLLQKVGELSFRPDVLARDEQSVEMIFAIIPGAKEMIARSEGRFLRFPHETSMREREKLRREYDAWAIGRIPDHFAGELSQQIFNSPFREQASLFDFINVFTEHAKQARAAARMEIESRAGALANYIAANQQKFVS